MWLVAARGEVYSLDEGETVLGSAPGCGLRFDSGQVASQHARLTVETDGTCFVERLASTPGTWRGTLELRPGRMYEVSDAVELRFGQVTLTARANMPSTPPLLGIRERVPDVVSTADAATQLLDTPLNLRSEQRGDINDNEGESDVERTPPLPWARPPSSPDEATPPLVRSGAAVPPPDLDEATMPLPMHAFEEPTSHLLEDSPTVPVPRPRAPDTLPSATLPLAPPAASYEPTLPIPRASAAPEATQPIPRMEAAGPAPSSILEPTQLVGEPTQLVGEPTQPVTRPDAAEPTQPFVRPLPHHAANEKTGWSTVLDAFQSSGEEPSAHAAADAAGVDEPKGQDDVATPELDDRPAGDTDESAPTDQGDEAKEETEEPQEEEPAPKRKRGAAAKEAPKAKAAPARASKAKKAEPAAEEEAAEPLPRRRGAKAAPTSSASDKAPAPAKRSRAASSDAADAPSSLPASTQGSSSDAGSQRRGRDKPRVIFTGIVDPQREKKIERLGGSVVDNVNDCTHLVTDKVRRTVKLLCAMSLGKHIVEPAWVDASSAGGAFAGAIYIIVFF